MDGPPPLLPAQNDLSGSNPRRRLDPGEVGPRRKRLACFVPAVPVRYVDTGGLLTLRDTTDDGAGCVEDPKRDVSGFSHAVQDQDLPGAGIRNREYIP